MYVHTMVRYKHTLYQTIVLKYDSKFTIIRRTTFHYFTKRAGK